MEVNTGSVMPAMPGPSKIQGTVMMVKKVPSYPIIGKMKCTKIAGTVKLAKPSQPPDLPPGITKPEDDILTR